MASAESKAEALLDEGRAHLDAGRREKAEACFRQAAKTYLTPTALNNWALCRHLAGDHRETVSLLAPLLKSPDPLPFTHALASQAYTALGEENFAIEEVRAAVRDLDRGLAGARAGDPAWIEYTATIKRAAGEAGDHRLVLDLHGRWPGREHPTGVFAAGVAAFNLGKFGQAAKYWRRIADPGWVRLMEAYILVAELAEQGTVPPFSLEYDPNYEFDPNDHSPAAVKAQAAMGAVRIRFLAMAFLKPDSSAPMIDALIGETGSWGIELGRRLLAAPRLPMGLKMGAAKALTDAGVLAPGQPISAVVDGRPTTIALQAVKIPDPELDRKVEEAIRLRDAGKRDAAYELLSNLERQGTIYPPAMVTLANLMRDRGELDAARKQLEMADKMMPDNPVVQFNLAGLWLQFRDPERALDYAKKIRTEELSPEFRQHVVNFIRTVKDQMGFITNVDPEMIADAYREEEEEKRLQLDLRLRTALRQIPVQWLNAGAAHYHVKPVPRRPEREKLLAEAILDPAQLKRLLAAERPEVRQALRFLLEKGGWAKLQVLTRRFGSLDGDGFSWDEKPPASPVGRLRLLGLVFVGRAIVDNKMHKVAVVPVELRGVKWE
ncbi:MAG TPA: hypothetical protein VD969_04410 [Symbiobacteriaceae bacterium]|nr:hypothetical protein [Symbiobacteriaceae bacterium]